MNNETKKQKIILAPGEFAFGVCLLAFGIIGLILSIKLFAEASGNKLASAGALPLIASIVLVALSVYILIKETIFLKREDGSIFGKIKKAIFYVFPKDLVVVILAIAAYSFILFLGLNFYIASAIFLWGLMSYLSRGKLIRNILITAIVVLILFLIFGLAFGVGLV